MRGTQLSQLRYMVRAEVGSSLTSSDTGANNDLTFNQLLSNKQQWLATEYDWPFLDTQFNQQAGIGFRYLTLPLVNLERPFKFEVKWNALWQDVDYGVASPEYNFLDSDLGVLQDPIQRWRVADQIEVYPPLVAMSQLVTGSSVLNGAYKYAVTFVTSNGETTPNPTVTANPSNQTVHLSNIPIGATAQIEGVNFPVVMARNLYRTIAGGTTLFFLATIADNTTTTYVDAGADLTFNQFISPPTYSSAEVTAYEIWPLPASVATIRMTGQRLLSPLVLDTDTADLDDQMLVLFCAADWLSRKKQADAQLKLQAAQARMTYIRSAYPRRTRDIIVGGGTDRAYNKIAPVKIIATAGQ